MSRPGRLAARTFASVRKHRNYRLYFGGQAVSFTGTWMQQIASAWLVLTLTHSAVAVGALTLCQLLPVSVLGLFVGTLVDRFDNRMTSIVTEATSMVIAALFAGLTLAGRITVWEVFALSVVQGVVWALDSPARSALIYQIVGIEDLANGVALSSSLGTLVRILGPAIGGGVVAVAGAGVAFAINAASYLAILASLLAMDTSRFAPTVRDRQARLVRGAADGLRLLATSRSAAVAFVTVFILATFSFNYTVLLPLVARDTLHQGAQVFGLIAAVFGAGALGGAIINATRGRASLRLLLAGAAGFGVFDLALAPATSLAPVCVLLFGAGVCYTLWGTNALSTMQLEAPASLRGRAVSLYYFALQGGAPLGGLLAGWLVDVDGTGLPFAIGGVVALAAAAAGVSTLRRAPAGRVQLRRRDPRSAVA